MQTQPKNWHIFCLQFNVLYLFFWSKVSRCLGNVITCTISWVLITIVGGSYDNFGILINEKGFHGNILH